MTTPTSNCPSGLGLLTSPKRSCRKTVNRGTSSTSFATFGLPYNRVCGYCLGYQFGTPDSFLSSSFQTTVDSCYADGVLLSYNHPREHLWTFAAMRDCTQRNSYAGCPCNSTRKPNRSRVPRFVGNDLFCETGILINDILYTEPIMGWQRMWNTP